MSRHLLIAGTGRTGTSFLVRYLTRLGLETHLSRARETAEWDEAAQAGLEDFASPDAPNLPYVIKSPWTYQLIHDILARGQVQLDAVVIPLRDLTEAASSRTIIETRSMYRKMPWMGDLDRAWEHLGHTPGGIVYSLSPVDQARLLAVGFHQLLHQLVRADIPVVLLDCPRLIEDAAYLVGKLLPVLPAGISAGDASLAHAEVADPAKLRVGRELCDKPDGFHLDGPGPERLERAALVRLLAETRRDLQAARDEVTGITLMGNARDAALAQAHDDLRQAQSTLASAQAAAASSMAQRDALVQRLADAETALATASARAAELQSRLRQEEAGCSLLRARIAAIEASASRRSALWLARAPRLAAMLTWLLPRAMPGRRPRSAGHGR